MGSVGNYNQPGKLTAWSPVRSLQSLIKFFGISGGAATSAWYLHPHLLNLAANTLHLDFKDSVTAFQTSFFSTLSLLFAIYSGNTMAFLYDRQKEVVKNLYAECMALEELLEEAVNALGPDARDILQQIRVYIEQEIHEPENQSPPLGEGFALATMRSKVRNYRRAGTDVGEIMQASQRLAHAQSTRQASACRLLPPVHWALLYSIGVLFVSTFILFETGGSFSNEGRHILFTVLCGLMSFVLVALRDLADPSEGVYNATALLGERLTYITAMLDKYQKLPARMPATNAILGTSIPAAVMEETLMEKTNDNKKTVSSSGLSTVSRMDGTPGEDGSASPSAFGDAIKRVVENGLGGVVDVVSGARAPDEADAEAAAPAKDSRASMALSGPSTGAGAPAERFTAEQADDSGMSSSARRSQSELFGGSARGVAREAGRADADHGKGSPELVGRLMRAGGDVGVGSLRDGADVRTKLLKSSIVQKPKSFRTQPKPLAGARKLPQRSLSQIESIEEQLAALAQASQGHGHRSHHAHQFREPHRQHLSR